MALALNVAARPTLFSIAPRILSSLRPSWSILCEPSTSSSAAFPSASSASLIPSFPSIRSLLELLPPLVLTTPKKKTSHRRKAERSMHKQLKNRSDISTCDACGHPHLLHHICPNCYSQITRRWKAEARGDNKTISPPVTGGESAPASV